jgi:hypothetical protein
MSEWELSDEEVARQIAAFDADARAFELRRAELTRLYPDRFVLFHKGEVIGEAADLDSLRELLIDNDLGRLDPVVEFLHSKKVTLRLARD